MSDPKIVRKQVKAMKKVAKIYAKLSNDLAKTDKMKELGVDERALDDLSLQTLNQQDEHTSLMQALNTTFGPGNCGCGD